ncbi:MAG: hypothetical protein JO342_05935 [Solirubrobacterales bacterium]|nr:hypothetical protein [Solirubrobacterales bacterium]MBV9165674.1 hypothetical protein [Solirubrobacterales bacterium]
MTEGITDRAYNLILLAEDEARMLGQAMAERGLSGGAGSTCCVASLTIRRVGDPARRGRGLH